MVKYVYIYTYVNVVISLQVSVRFMKLLRYLREGSPFLGCSCSPKPWELLKMTKLVLKDLMHQAIKLPFHLLDSLMPLYIWYRSHMYIYIYTIYIYIPKYIHIYYIQIYIYTYKYILEGLFFQTIYRRLQQHPMHHTSATFRQVSRTVASVRRCLLDHLLTLMGDFFRENFGRFFDCLEC